MNRFFVFSSLIFGLLNACTGRVGGRPSDHDRLSQGGNANDPDDGVGGIGGGIDDGFRVLSDPRALGPVGMRRLSRTELKHSIQSLTGIAQVASLDLLPEDVFLPFDNEYNSQSVSAVVVSALDDLAKDVVEQVFATDALRRTLVPCKPVGPADVDCLAQFVSKFGRRALRRPLSPDEIAEFVAFGNFSRETADFYTGVRMAARALLQDPEFVYHLEPGIPVEDDLVRLGPYEIAARLSFLLRGTIPDDELLDRAANGELDTPQGIEMAARSLLQGSEASRQLGRFHAMWLGYDDMRIDPKMAASFRTEMDALVERIVLEEQRPWSDLLKTDEAFVDKNLAEIYEVDAPEIASWHSLQDPRRQGLLARAGYLVAGVKFDDTSPVLRGIQVRERLTCDEIPPPPPNVNADEPPKADPSACKQERYAAHRESGCAACHQSIDPVGEGLESYDGLGRFRKHELNRPDCPVAGDGQFTEKNLPFNGPADLARIVLQDNAVQRCLVTHLLSYSDGRPWTDGSPEVIDGMNNLFLKKGERLTEFLPAFVSSNAFRHRLIKENNR